MSVAYIEDKRVQNFAFTSPLQQAMNIFDCRSYHPGKLRSYDYTFYGIAQNTAVAAMALEMCYSLILNWALSKVGISAKHSYCLGIASGLIGLANQEKKAWVASNEKFADQITWWLRTASLSTDERGPLQGYSCVQGRQRDSKKLDVRSKRLR